MAGAPATGGGSVSAADPVQFQRPVADPSADSILDARAAKPIAQEADLDAPELGSARETSHSAQAASENTPPPPEDLPTQPQQPLPDLRQGLPSTFDIEFGGAAARKAAEQEAAEAEAAAAGRNAGSDLTTAASPAQRERGEREYTRSDYETSLDRRRAKFQRYLYLSLLLAMAGAGAYLARPITDDEPAPSGLAPESASGWSPVAMYNRLAARLGSSMGYYTEPTFPKLLPEIPADQRPPYTLVLSLEDLLIHSSWDRTHGYRTAKRPGMDYFIRYLSQYYELVLFTSVPLAMADPVIKKLDPYHFIMWPLGREGTKYEGGEYVKDLSYLNRDLKKTLIVDTKAGHVRNQPENAIVLPKWSGEPKDEHTGDLVALIPFLEYLATMQTDDVRTVLASFAEATKERGVSIPVEFARREALARARFQRQYAADSAKRPKRSLGSIASAFGMKSGPPVGGMVLGDGQSVSEGLAQGKMLSDLMREQGQKQYEFLEKQIRENGAQWLAEEEAEVKRQMEEGMKDMKKNTFSWFGGGGKKE